MCESINRGRELSHRLFYTYALCSILLSLEFQHQFWCTISQSKELPLYQDPENTQKTGYQELGLPHELGNKLQNALKFEKNRHKTLLSCFPTTLDETIAFNFLKNQHQLAVSRNAMIPTTIALFRVHASQYVVASNNAIIVSLKFPLSSP